MAKPAIVFVCADCGSETLKWQGQCPQCAHWNTLEQRTVARRPAGQVVVASPSVDLAGLTAAHKPLPFGACAEVRNLRNDRSVRVRINDRGPFVTGRVIDLSRAAADRIGLLEKGVAPVRVSAVGAADARGRCR
jgi:hypothetical protein